MNFKNLFLALSLFATSCQAAKVTITPYNHKKDECDLKRIIEAQIPQDFNDDEINSGIEEVRAHMDYKGDEPIAFTMIKVGNKNTGYIIAALPTEKDGAADVFLFCVPETHQEEVLQAFIKYLKKNTIACGLNWPDFGTIPEDVFTKCGFQAQSNWLLSYYALNFK
ncbi:MAG: hypothetical protein P4L31_00285 [Candidatus Babeliales bacterium]|nr:hypothetical protein [Candidatus Babeliales bacterium]